MKKLLVVIAMIIMILSINKEEKVIIPKDAIRFRVIANSNNLEDQKLKQDVVYSLKQTLKSKKDIKTVDEARIYIKKQVPLYEQNIRKTLKENNSEETFKINYGKNYFPRKEYKNVIYDEGEYESLVVTLGKGKGKNFWCVLFPPLCLIDENDNIEYKSYIKEIIDKYF